MKMTQKVAGRDLFVRAVVTGMRGSGIVLYDPGIVEYLRSLHPEEKTYRRKLLPVRPRSAPDYLATTQALVNAVMIVQKACEFALNRRESTLFLRLADVRQADKGLSRCEIRSRNGSLF